MGEVRRFIRMKEVSSRVGFDKATVYRWIVAETFPAPTKVGRFSVWWEHEVADWMRAQAAA